MYRPQPAPADASSLVVIRCWLLGRKHFYHGGRTRITEGHGGRRCMALRARRFWRRRSGTGTKADDPGTGFAQQISMSFSVALRDSRSVSVVKNRLLPAAATKPVDFGP